ncbi:hypothetical protein [Stieleria mannarensis]|uniref:hypothetical protein n=1 Tax=Stieleria mannarensis TaxID=2755585 RepID=UPI001600A859|nr:hypothetical protein [Rhodopirellula sp. JC639]
MRSGSLWAITLVCIFAALLTPRRAEGGSNSPIYAAASDYRDAVREFERVVLRTPKIRSSVERLVDDLEDSTSDLKSAARDPARLDRLLSRFVATDALHCRVELTFFGDPIFPAEPRLEESWIAVHEAYARLVYEVHYLQQLRSAKRGRPIAIVDHRYDQPPAYVPAPAVGDPGVRGPVYRSRTIDGNRSAAAAAVGPYSGSVASPYGAQLQRSPGAAFSGAVFSGAVFSGAVSTGAAAPTRRIISTPEQLRSAILGAILQRQR